MNSYFQKMVHLMGGILSSGHLSSCPSTEFLHGKGFSLMVLISSMVISVSSDSFNFLKNILFFNYVCMCGFIPAGAGACKGQKMVPGPLQKEFQATQYAGTQHTLNSLGFVCNFKPILFQNKTSQNHIFHILLFLFLLCLTVDLDQSNKQ